MCCCSKRGTSKIDEFCQQNVRHACTNCSCGEVESLEASPGGARRIGGMLGAGIERLVGRRRVTEVLLRANLVKARDAELRGYRRKATPAGPPVPEQAMFRLAVFACASREHHFESTIKDSSTRPTNADFKQTPPAGADSHNSCTGCFDGLQRCCLLKIANRR